MDAAMARLASPNRVRDISYLAFNFASVVVLVFVNKYVFTQVNFPFSTLLTLVHYLTNWGLLLTFSVLGMFVAPSKAHPKRFRWLVLALGLATPLNNLSLKLNSFGVYQVIKLLVIPGIVLMEWVLHGKTISTKRVLCLAALTLGSAVATVTDLKFSMEGTLVALVWIPVAVAYKVLWSEAQKVDGWPTMPLMHEAMPWASLWVGALVPALDPPGILEFEATLYGALLILASGVAAFLVNWSGFLVIGACSPMTHQLLGQAKSVITMLGGYLLFGQHYSWVSLLGCNVAMGSVIVYTDLNLKENAAKEALAEKDSDDDRSDARSGYVRCH